MENRSATKKLDLYIDADDTILLSSQAIVEILCERYGKENNIDLNQSTQYFYKDIDKNITEKEIQEIYSSQEFFDIVQIDKAFIDFYTKARDKFNFHIVTKGTEKNLELKKNYFLKVFGYDFVFHGIPFVRDEDVCGVRVRDFDKSSVDMRGGIQIDDVTEAVAGTNATIKILLKRYGEKNWNARTENISNLYIVNNWGQTSEIINYANENEFFMEECL